MGLEKRIKLYGDVGFVVTENCPFDCPHCLRGNRRPNTMKKEFVDMFLDQAIIKGRVFLYGGEALMRSTLASYIINQIYNHGNIPKSINVVTNGSVCAEKFESIVATLKENKARFNISISNDCYHEEERKRLNGGVDNISEIFAIYKLILKKYGYGNSNRNNHKCSIAKYEPFTNGEGLLKVGRAVNIPGAQPIDLNFEFDPRNRINENSYVGHITLHCDGTVAPSEDSPWEEKDIHFGPEYNIMKRSLRQILPRR